jgi:dihydrofolate reductase
MSRVIVIEFTTVDGIVEDPDGTGRTERGGWAFRYGPESVAGDKFKLGRLMDTGTLLLGRATWQLFSHIWPGRSDEFSTRMNQMPKLVVSHSLKTVDGWNNSTLLDGSLVDEVSKRKREQDLVVAGSGSVVRTLIEHDLVDEYRLLVFPVVLGEGTGLFPAAIGPVELEVVSAEPTGAATLMTYRRVRPAPHAR